MIENKSSLHLDIAVKTSMGLGSCVVQFLALMKRGNSWFGVSIRGAINRIYIYTLNLGKCQLKTSILPFTPFKHHTFAADCIQ